MIDNFAVDIQFKLTDIGSKLAIQDKTSNICVANKVKFILNTVKLDIYKCSTCECSCLTEDEICKLKQDLVNYTNECCN